MQGAALIYGSSKKSREETLKTTIEKIFTQDKANTNIKADKNPDILSLKPEKNKKSIGIDQVRRATKFLAQRPYQSENKVVIVRDAHLLSMQAQNAFLKTLEEPPQYATIVLEAPSKGGLLDTVLSRCRQLRVKPDKKDKENTLSWKKIRRLSAGHKMELAEKLSKKDTRNLVKILDHWISSERESLKNNQTAKPQNLKTLNRVRNDLTSTNVNAQLALEFLLLHVS